MIVDFWKGSVRDDLSFKVFGLECWGYKSGAVPKYALEGDSEGYVSGSLSGFQTLRRKRHSLLVLKSWW